MTKKLTNKIFVAYFDNGILDECQSCDI
jgi:hypothetical protein